MTDTLETILDLGSVCGGAKAGSKPGFNLGLCFDNVWPWAAAGAIDGGGALVSGAAAAMTTPACGNGTQTPATLLKNALFAPGKEPPFEKARFGPNA